MSVSRLIMTGPYSVMTRWHFVAFGVPECFICHVFNDQKPDFDQFNFTIIKNLNLSWQTNNGNSRHVNVFSTLLHHLYSIFIFRSDHSSGVCLSRGTNTDFNAAAVIESVMKAQVVYSKSLACVPINIRYLPEKRVSVAVIPILMLLLLYFCSLMVAWNILAWATCKTKNCNHHSQLLSHFIFSLSHRCPIKHRPGISLFCI